MDQLRVGSPVLHNGMEKTISEIHGDVVILSDKSVISVDEVILNPGAGITPEHSVNPVVEPENEELAEMHAAEKAALRRNLEDINHSTPAIALFALMKEVDSTMTISAMDENDIEHLRSTLIHKAVRAGKIDPKVCDSCGQVIPE